MGACSGKPKTAELEEIVKHYPHGLQVESEKQFSGDKKIKPTVCEQRLNRVGVNQQKLTSIDHSPQTYPLNEVLESQNKSLTETSPGHNRKPRMNEDCERDPQLLPSTEKIDIALQFQKEKADTQNPAPLSKVGVHRDVKIEKSETQDEPMKSPNEPQTYGSKHVSETRSALTFSKIHDSEWTTLDFTASSSDSSSEVKGSETSFAGSLASSSLHPKAKYDVTVTEVSMVERSSHTDLSISGCQSRETQEQWQSQKLCFGDNMNGFRASPALANKGVDNQMVKGNESHMIPAIHDETHVVLKKQGSSANFLDFTLTEEVSSTNQVKLDSIVKQDNVSNQALHVVEAIYGNNPEINTDVDQMLEKLASEFERQESLSSFFLS